MHRLYRSPCASDESGQFEVAERLIADVAADCQLPQLSSSTLSRIVRDRDVLHPIGGDGLHDPA